MEELRKQFIVNEKEFNSKNTEKFIRGILNFIKIGQDGGIFLELDSMGNAEKIRLAITARFLANKLDKNIPSEVSLPEIMKALSLPQNTTTARISELIKQRAIKRVKAGKYLVIPYKIEEFIDKINKKYGIKNNND